MLSRFYSLESTIIEYTISNLKLTGTNKRKKDELSHLTKVFSSKY